MTITPPNIRTDPPSLFIILALAWMLETANEHALYVSSYVNTEVRHQIDYGKEFEQTVTKCH